MILTLFAVLCVMYGFYCLKLYCNRAMYQQKEPRHLLNFFKLNLCWLFYACWIFYATKKTFLFLFYFCVNILKCSGSVVWNTFQSYLLSQKSNFYWQCLTSHEGNQDLRENLLENEKLTLKSFHIIYMILWLHKKTFRKNFHF